MQSAEVTIFEMATRPRISPPRVATAVMTSGTPCPAASGAMRCTRRPTSRPPSAGRKMTAAGPMDASRPAMVPKKSRCTAASE